jgi:predicted SAM-dependent methyltransferase
MIQAQEYLATHAVAKLQVGCGGNVLPGWLNTDGQMDGWVHPQSVRLDATQPFPLPDCAFDYVYSEHMIEHITWTQGQLMLQECFRVMKPGGRIRISCPDINFLIKLYQDPDELDQAYMAHTTPAWAPYPSAIFTFNNFVRDWGHKFIYDQETLSLSLQAAGFETVTSHRVRESADPNLQNLEIVSRMPEGMLQLETMTLEAVKPLNGN